MCRGPLTCNKPISVCPQLANEVKSSSSTTTTSKRPNSKDWWARSVAKRTVSFVEAEVETLTSTCRFIQETPICQEIKSLNRNDLELGPLVGKGGFSEVYQVLEMNTDNDDFNDSLSSFDSSVSADAATTSTDRLVVKHLCQDLMAQRTKFHQAAADLVLESEFLARLNHPHILKIKGWASEGVSSFGDGTHDGFFIVLEQLEETLSQTIQSWNDNKENMDAESLFATKLQYAVEIASALTYLHERDIMFRDLKPDNIGLKDGKIKLFDLGLCRELPEAGATASGKVFEMSGVGTRRYMAPEIAMSKGYNLSADVYSFAMVLYELFTQERPFDLYNADMHQLLVCEEGQRPTLPKDMPLALQSLLQQAWAADSSERPTMANVLAQLEDMAAPLAATAVSTTNNSNNSNLGVTLQRFFSTFHKMFSGSNASNNSIRSNCNSYDNNNTSTTVGMSSASWIS